MALARLIRRAAPLIALGVAGAAAARRRAERHRRAPLAPPTYPPPVQVEPAPEPEPLPDPVDEQPTEETAIERAPWLESEPKAPVEPEAEDASVTEIVDDLLAPGDDTEAAEDATVVDGSAVEETPDEDDD